MQTNARDRRRRHGTWTVAPRGVSLVALALLVACAGPPPPPPKPTVAKASIVASPSANPDVRKRPSPIVVRIYELKAAASFDTADFGSLYDRDQATLGTELVGREEFTLRPGETKVWEKVAGPETRFIAVMAAFRDIDRAKWKALLPLKPNTVNAMTVRIDENAIGVLAP